MTPRRMPHSVGAGLGDAVSRVLRVPLRAVFKVVFRLATTLCGIRPFHQLGVVAVDGAQCLPLHGIGACRPIAEPMPERIGALHRDQAGAVQPLRPRRRAGQSVEPFSAGARVRPARSPCRARTRRARPWPERPAAAARAASAASMRAMHARAGSRSPGHPAWRRGTVPGYAPSGWRALRAVPAAHRRSRPAARRARRADRHRQRGGS